MRTIHQVFVSSIVSGPETLVLPNLAMFPGKPVIVILQETRNPIGLFRVAEYAKTFGHDVIEIPIHGRIDFGALNRLVHFWKIKHPGIIHAHGPKASLYATLANQRSGEGSRSLMITTHHGVRANDRSFIPRVYEELYEKAVIPSCDLCLTVCSSDRELLIRRGVCPSKLQVHLNGVDRTLINASDRGRLQFDVRREWARACGKDTLDGFLIGVVGRLDVEKQYHRVLKAIAHLTDKYPDFKVRLLCFGSGPLETELKSLSEHLGIARQVHWMGYRTTIADEMAGLDLLLSLSNAEGLPINLIEAGWSGTPVVAQGVDGILDLIENGKSGILLAPPASDSQVADAIYRLANDDRVAATLGMALQDRVQKHFSGSVWINRLQEIYNRASKTRASESNRPSS